MTLKLLVLAFAALLVMPRFEASGAQSGSTVFQSPPSLVFQSPLTPTATAMATATATATVTRTPTIEPTRAPAMTTVAPARAAAPTAATNYLPPPTLTQPGAMPSGPLFAGPRPLAGATPMPTPTSTPSGPQGTAAAIDQAIVALGYVWLCCGAGTLTLAALGVVWLFRRPPLA